MNSTRYQLQTSDQSIDWFLDNVIIQDIGKVIQCGAGYLAFALIGQAIETLGALLDENDFDEEGESENRFGKAITDLFTPNPRYAELNKKDSEFYLYENLRCGMAHILRPHSRVVFIGESDAKNMDQKHLSVIRPEGYAETQLLLVLETLYDDLKEACRRAKNAIKKKTHPKLKQGYITVSQFTYHFENADQAYNVNLPKGSSLDVTAPGESGGFVIRTSITGVR